MDQRPRSGRRRNRRAARQYRRRQRYGRFLWFTAVGTLVPGTGLLAAGRKSGKLVLWIVAICAVVTLVVAWRTGLRGLVSSASDPAVLGTFALCFTLVAVGWLTVALASHRALEPHNLPAGKRLVGSVVLMTTASLVVAPLALGARYAWTARDTIGMVSRESDNATQVEDASDPWRDLPHVTVLLMGSDAGAGRAGTRPDTLIAASIDTDTGDTMMFSLPRQLSNVPFPEGSVLDAWYPGGFEGGDPLNPDNWINAVYRHAPDEALAEAYPTSDDPRADAVKDAVSAVLGIPIDYYVIADLNGFERLVDAMDGVALDVPYPVPMGTKMSDGRCIWSGADRESWIEPGEDVELSGAEALWFARSRCAPYNAAWPDQTGLQSPITLGSDHNRMERQRCMMGAIARSADPFTLLTNFESLAGAAQRSVATDVPPSLWTVFAELGVKVKDADISSIVFNKDGLAEAGAGTTAEPDFDAIAAAVAAVLEPDESGTSAATEGAPTDDEQADPSGDESASGDDSAPDEGAGSGADSASGEERADEESGEPEVTNDGNDSGAATPEESPAEPASTC